MDPNNNPFNFQNSINYPFNYQNPSNYQFESQSSNQQRPQNIPNFGFAPNMNMHSPMPNFHPYYGTMMQFQPPPYNPYMSIGNETVPTTGTTEFSTQMALGSMGAADEATPTVDDSTTVRKRNPKWTTEQNLTLISGWIKYGTDSVVGRNQKSESYWGKVAEYCNQYCAFDQPRDGAACRNHYNYINKILGKWIGAYDNAKRLKQSGWSETDVLAKAHELYKSANNAKFTLMEEWQAIRDQPRYGSQVGGFTGSNSSGSKRSRESDVGESNSVASMSRPMGREATKKKGKKKGKAAALEVVDEEWTEFRKLKEKELERLDRIAAQQEEANKQMKARTDAKKMNMWLKLKMMEHLDDQSKELFERLGTELFGN